jgi:hypothetical protein
MQGSTGRSRERYWDIRNRERYR